MMRSSWALLLKVLLASILISIGIKYAGSWLSLAATSRNALTLILLPTFVFGVLFIWRARY